MALPVPLLTTLGLRFVGLPESKLASVCAGLATVVVLSGCGAAVRGPPQRRGLWSGIVCGCAGSSTYCAVAYGMSGGVPMWW
jgi:hypothetical protein